LDDGDNLFLEVVLFHEVFKHGGDFLADRLACHVPDIAAVYIVVGVVVPFFEFILDGFDAEVAITAGDEALAFRFLMRVVSFMAGCLFGFGGKIGLHKSCKE